MAGAGTGTPEGGTANGPGSKGAQTRQAILDAAVARFGRDGFRGTKVADIARDAGVGSTITFNYFANKDELFLAALDADAAGAIESAATTALTRLASGEVGEALIMGAVDAVEQHPLARRVLAGLEPHATAHLLEIPALGELRKGITEQFRADQAAGRLRADVDPAVIANAMVAVVLSMIMSILQFGADGALSYAGDVLALFEAAITPAPPAPGAS